jgi:S-adenosylmethionine hydrolase
VPGTSITFLSDYGLEDFFVGVCHGVIARICPDAHVLDVTHSIPRHDIRAGALALLDSLPYLPAGVHLAVVDPGVGGSRRAVALRTADGQYLVGPDNGLLWLGAQSLGGVAQAVDIGATPCALEPLSASFHGRDIFAPVSGHLANGRALADLGRPIHAGDLVPLELPSPQVGDRTVHAEVIAVDRFGNLILNVGRDELGRVGIQREHELLVTFGERTTRLRCVSTFADVAPGETLAFVDAQQRLSLAVNLGSAAEALMLKQGSSVTLAVVPET